MADFFSSGRVVDFVLVVMAIEAVVLSGLRQRLALRAVPADIFAALLPGVLLLLALRAALLQVSWLWVALFLTLALPAHLADVWHRCRRPWM